MSFIETAYPASPRLSPPHADLSLLERLAQEDRAGREPADTRRDSQISITQARQDATRHFYGHIRPSGAHRGRAPLCR